MFGHHSTEDLIDYLDILAQQPGRDIYTQVCLCYPVTDDSVYTIVVDTLTKGLERLTISFPWIAGQVVNEGAYEGNTGVIKVKALEKIPRLIVKDLRDDPSMPTMNGLRDAHFPMSMLDEKHIAPRRTNPGHPDEPFSDFPVFLLQANFITGGLILTFNGHHSAMDMSGQGQVMSLLSKACRDEPFTLEEVETGNLSRRNLTPVLEESWQLGNELDRQLRKANPRTSNDASPSLPLRSSTWANFSFSEESLQNLKSLTTKTPPLSSGFISTDDALSAFIWQSVTRVRLPRIDPNVEVTFGRAVNSRRYLDVPPTYPGLLVTMSYHTSAPQKLVDAPLGIIASELRAAIDPKTTKLGYLARALATYLHRSPDKRGVSSTASIKSDKDLVLSSWAKTNCYDLDFGLGLGKPESVRRPRYVPDESLIYLLPRSLDGEITAAICLWDEDMEKLKADEEFSRFGRYIG